ncbi:MAG: DNA polymerase I [Flavobacteriaceae bacterium]|nr:DNA polymerase I [Flavobacteriaceae bacterium]
MKSKRLFLIDAYALIFRGYYAFIKNPRINSKGVDTSAILGFTNSLFDVIKREKPDYLAVCFDKGGSQDRIEIFSDYKANRDETPEAIKIAVPYIESILKSLNIPVVVKSGFEADDIIGTLSKKAEKKGFQTFMVTPDKDFAQLVSENIFMYRPMFGGGYETWGVDEVKKKFEVNNPLQVIDFLGMKGDAVDNIPGLPGVGDKTAKKFIAEFGNMENLLNNTDKLKGKLKEKVEENKEKGLLSKKLATIILDVPIEFNPIEFKFEVKNTEDLKKIFLELEFRRLIDSVDKTFEIQLTDSINSITKKNNKSEITKLESQTQKFSAGSGQFSLFDGTENEREKIEYLRKDINNTNHYYQKIDTELATNLFFKKILNQSLVSYSIYSNNIDPLTDDILGIAFSWEENKCYYISAENNNSIRFFKRFFENSSIEKTSQNIKTDIKILKKYGITINGKIFDITLAHYLINPDISHDLSLLSETYLNYSKINLQLLLGKGKLKKEISNLETNIIIDIACENCDIILQLKSLFSKELIDSNLITLFNKIETPLLKVLAEMEYEGINLDVNFLKSLSNDLNSDLIKLENKIFVEAGEKFNISSPKQLGEVLFEKMQLSKNPKKTKSGQYSTAEDILAELSKKHDFVKKILKFRSLSKLKNTYVDSLPAQVLKKTKRVHTEYLQTVASTGRLSSINPNLQNIPIRTERGKQIRKAFIPKNKDYTILAADYSQIELRIIASISDEENMIMAFKNNEDIHASTAAQVFDIDLKDVSKSQRSNAKTVNFGIIYGVSAFGLSNQTNLSRSESKDLIDTYYKKYSKLKTFISKQISLARSNGYVETLSGRKRYLRNINSSNGLIRSAAERNAVNAPIQGTAADIIKIAMINIFNKFSEAKLKSKMLLQVHDELVFDVFNDEIELVKSIIKQEMENAFTLKVPLTIDMDQGNNWLEAH